MPEGSFSNGVYKVNDRKELKQRLGEIFQQSALVLAQEYFYTDFDFFSDVHLFDNDDYYILKKGDEIIAGIQANPVHWKIKSLPGASGKFLVNMHTAFPDLRKLSTQ